MNELNFWFFVKKNNNYEEIFIIFFSGFQERVSRRCVDDDLAKNSFWQIVHYFGIVRKNNQHSESDVKDEDEVKKKK
jgi:hypothetical protein